MWAILLNFAFTFISDMKAKKIYFILVGLICCMCACTSHENSGATGLGRIRITAEIVLPDADERRPDGVPTLELQSADGTYSHSWKDIHEFPTGELYYAGAYNAVSVLGKVGAEGFDCACYMAEEQFTVEDGGVAKVDLNLTLSQARAKVDINGVSGPYEIAAVTLHSEGNGYVSFVPSERRTAYLQPGKTEIYVSVLDRTGRAVSLVSDMTMELRATDIYDISVECDADGNLVVGCGGEESTVHITEDLFSSRPPEISASGFTPGAPVLLTEGFPSEHPIMMDVTAPAGLSKLMLTLSGNNGNSNLLHGQIDLLQTSLPGVDVTLTGDTHASVDFSAGIESISVDATTDVTVTLQARDRLGRVSDVMTLVATINSVALTLKNTTSAVIGEDIASVTVVTNAPQVEPKDFSVMLLPASDSETETAAQIIDARILDDNSVQLTFRVPEGTGDVPVRIDYMDNNKLWVTIERAVPYYGIVVDAFATTAIVSVSAEKPEVVKAVTKYAKISADGRDVVAYKRDPERGIIMISDLAPSRRYTIEPVVIKGQYAPHQVITTEAAAQVPAGDFEDPKDEIDYENLEAGGAYSTTTFPIYNRQNKTDISVDRPEKHWASVNAKTFCMRASRHNTWYMQPSAELVYGDAPSGSKAMKITSVGWDLNGPEIPPYMQNEGESLHYNANVPPIAHRAAGKLFLGSYSFDPVTLTERYDMGVTFGSRPSSLNGFYKYVPDKTVTTDQGLVRIELINDAGSEEVMIASAEMYLSNAPDYKAFNLQLSYEYFNIKATRLRILFSSSAAAGDIGTEDTAVPVTPDMQSSALIGSSLWIDNLSFSY